MADAEIPALPDESFEFLAKLCTDEKPADFMFESFWAEYSTTHSWTDFESHLDTLKKWWQKMKAARGAAGWEFGPEKQDWTKCCVGVVMKAFSESRRSPCIAQRAHSRTFTSVAELRILSADAVRAIGKDLKAVVASAPVHAAFKSLKAGRFSTRVSPIDYDRLYQDFYSYVEANAEEFPRLWETVTREDC